MRVFGYTSQGQTDICDDIFREKIYQTIKISFYVHCWLITVSGQFERVLALKSQPAS